MIHSLIEKHFLQLTVVLSVHPLLHDIYQDSGQFLVKNNLIYLQYAVVTISSIHPRPSILVSLGHLFWFGFMAYQPL